MIRPEPSAFPIIRRVSTTIGTPHEDGGSWRRPGLYCRAVRILVTGGASFIGSTYVRSVDAD